MIQKISIILSKFAANNLALPLRDEQILQYCFEQVLSKILFSVLILVFGFFSNRFIISVLFLASFILLRSFGGGAHAHNRILCAILSYGISFTVIFCTPYLCLIVPDIFFLVLYSFFIIYSLFKAPVDCKNKRISGRKRQIMHLKYIISALLLTVSFGTFFVLEYKTAYGIISICAMIFGISLIIGELQNRKEKVNAIQNCCLR